MGRAKVNKTSVSLSRTHLLEGQTPILPCKLLFLEFYNLDKRPCIKIEYSFDVSRKNGRQFNLLI